MKVRQKFSRSRPGFAIIITVSILVLLAVVAVGLLTLSTVTVRGSQLTGAQAEAKANARLALALAIGDLQKALGPDRAVSARASAVSTATPQRPNLTGAWESWHWEPSLGSSPDYEEKKGRFQQWLVSSADVEEIKNFDFKDQAVGGDGIWLLNPDTTGVPAGRNASEVGVKAGVLESRTGTRTGGLAWAVFDESAKAPISLVGDEFDGTLERVTGRMAPPRVRADIVAEDLSGLADPSGLMTLETGMLRLGDGGGNELRGRFHDFTTNTYGVLADVANGGLKQDLTTLFESGADLGAATGTSENVYLPGASSAVKWDYLRDHYQAYTSVSRVGTGEPIYQVPSSDRKPGPDGLVLDPAEERLLPVIAKMQVVFSIVTHHNHVGDRVNFFNQNGNPKGNTNYGCPHLVYDPVVTLYNPYDVTLRIPRLRLRIWDPPVGFKFRKNGDYLRDEFARGEFHGLARFQIQNERNANARKYFTLVLTDPAGNGRPGRPIVMEPGEVKVFSPYVERQWTWGYETTRKGGSYSPLVFFDWNYGNDFGNRDGRTNNQFGLEATHGWDVRAGLQTDHVSYAARPNATRYDFELQHNWNGGWLGIKNTDTFSVEAKPVRTIASAAEPDFAVDLLAGQRQSTEQDLLRSYQFRFEDVTEELSDSPSQPVIERTFLVGDLLQSASDQTPGGKTPFAVLSMTAKTTADVYDVSKPWVHNNPVVEGALQDSREVGQAMQSYELKFSEVQDFNTFPGVEFDPDSKRGYYGAHATANEGVSNVPMHRVPLQPTVSLGEFVNANLVTSASLPRYTHPFGNAFAHPLIASGTVGSSAGPGGRAMLDHNYFLNDALWDQFYFSTVTDYNEGLASSDGRSSEQVLTDVLSGDKRALNRRLVSYSGEDASAAAQRLGKLEPAELSRALAGKLMVESPFNVNSDSVDAWRAVLSALRDQDVQGWGEQLLGSSERSSFPRSSLPLAGDTRDAVGSGFDLRGQIRWAGFRALTDDEVSTLAEEIVKEIRRRGAEDGAPSLTVGEFVNRRIGPASGVHVLRGLVETAIKNSQLNDEFYLEDSNEVLSATISDEAKRGALTPEAFDGQTAEAAPPMLSQGDVLAQLASVITVRGDTFKVRAYGESRSGGAVVARAWCEAVVQRVPEFVESTVAPETLPSALQSVNATFGRRFVVQSFRWLAPDEI